MLWYKQQDFFNYFSFEVSTLLSFLSTVETSGGLLFKKEDLLLIMVQAE